MWRANLLANTAQGSVFHQRCAIHFALCFPCSRRTTGLHAQKRTPCGFCFVEYFRRESAVDAERFLDGATLDGRVLKLEMDPGFQEGRQYGRGQTGGQVRDEFRQEMDQDRGTPRLHATRGTQLFAPLF